LTCTYKIGTAQSRVNLQRGHKTQIKVFKKNHKFRTFSYRLLVHGRDVEAEAFFIKHGASASSNLDAIFGIIYTVAKRIRE